MQHILDKLKEIDYKKYLVYVFIFIMLVIIIIEYIYLNNKISKLNNKSNIVENVIVEQETKEENVIKEIYVDIKGSVKKPGVYKLNENSRVIDVINMSGGLTKDANTRYINLSKILNDGDVIVIYSENEIKEAKKENQVTKEVPCVCEEIVSNACVEETTKETNNKININTASKEELMTLNGIGESKANAIITYREENGLFNTIEDVMNVSGISQIIYDKIKENITV